MKAVRGAAKAPGRVSSISISREDLDNLLKHHHESRHNWWRAAYTLEPPNIFDRPYNLHSVMYSVLRYIHIVSGEQAYFSRQMTTWYWDLDSGPEREFLRRLNWVCQSIRAKVASGRLKAFGIFVPHIQDYDAMSKAVFREVPKIWFNDDSMRQPNWGGIRFYEHEESLVPRTVDTSKNIGELYPTRTFFDMRKSWVAYASIKDGEAISTSVALEVQFKDEDLARVWPDVFAGQQGEEARRHFEEQAYRTGAPGRPSAMNRVIDEHRRRRLNSEAESSLAKEAAVLGDWLRETHPYAPPITPRGIQNGLRKAGREDRSREQAQTLKKAKPE